MDYWVLLKNWIRVIQEKLKTKKNIDTNIFDYGENCPGVKSFFCKISLIYKLVITRCPQGQLEYLREMSREMPKGFEFVCKKSNSF